VVGDVFVPKTVILELEWVLRYVADQQEGKVVDCLEHLIAFAGPLRSKTVTKSRQR
jgi:hypothetical protein